MPPPPKSIQQTFSGMKSEYAGMTENRFRRRRPGVNGVGGGGDRHYRNAERRFVRMREYTRAMVRDDAFAKVLGRTTAAVALGDEAFPS